MADTIQIDRFTVGPFEENCYLLVGPSGCEAALVDPGLGSEPILATLRERKLTLKWIINTHGHVDHVAGNKFFKDNTDARLVMHPDDVELASRASQQMQSLQMMGFGPGLEVSDSPPPDELFDEGVPLEFDGLRFDVIHTPGHSPGGVCLYHEGTLICGDTLFMGSIGRTDLPGGSGGPADRLHSRQAVPASRRDGVLSGARAGDHAGIRTAHEPVCIRQRRRCDSLKRLQSRTR